MPSKNGKNPDPIEGHSLERVEDHPFETVEPTKPMREVSYGPVPMSWNISQGRRHTDEGEKLVVIISIQTPEGDKVLFIEPDFGRQLGEAIIKMSEASANGVVYSE